MELKRFHKTTIEKLKFFRIMTGKTYEEIIEDALTNFHNELFIEKSASSDVTIYFRVPSTVYDEFNKSVSKLGITPSELLSFFVDLWNDNERSDSM